MNGLDLNVLYEHQVIKVEGPKNGIGAAILLNWEEHQWEAVMFLDPVPPYPVDKYVVDYKYKANTIEDAVRMFNALTGKPTNEALTLEV